MSEHIPLSERIQSIRQQMNVDYVKPDPKKLEGMIEALWASPEALSYLTKVRQLTEDTIRHFKLGYSAEKNGIAIPVFKNGVLCNIKYRLLEGEQRYTGEAGAEMWLFNEEGINVGRKKGLILIVEGEFDCMAAYQAGFQYVITPSGGKDSYGIWLEQLEAIKRIYIAYDNDLGGRESSRKIAERLGLEKCYEVSYSDVKDANEFFIKHDVEAFKGLLKDAKPFVRQNFKTVGDIITSLRNQVDTSIISKFIPAVKFQKGWLAILSGKSNVGKTSYVMNIANELAAKGTGVLIMPFERGIESVGQRFLQVRYKASPQDMSIYDAKDWDRITHDAMDLPLYFAMPNKEEILDFIVKSKRYFNTEVVIIDHLDYMVRQLSGANRGDAIMDTLQQLKRVAEDNGIVLLIVSHIRKIERPGEFISKTHRPNIEDLKGSSSLYQDPEVVVMLSETGKENEIVVDVLKNKGEMQAQNFEFKRDTGEYIPTFGTSSSREIEADVALREELWNSSE